MNVQIVGKLAAEYKSLKLNGIYTVSYFNKDTQMISVITPNGSAGGLVIGKDVKFPEGQARISDSTVAKKLGEKTSTRFDVFFSENPYYCTLFSLQNGAVHENINKASLMLELSQIQDLPALIPETNIKQFFSKEQPATEKKETPEEAALRKRQERLDKLLELQTNILKTSDQEVIKRPALVSKYDAKQNKLVPILTQGIMAAIQGKSGTHKSRLAENFAALILSNDNDKINLNYYLNYEKDASFKTAIVYADTERETEEEFPTAIQRIRRLAGYNSYERIPNFFPMSFSEEERPLRLESLLIYLEWVKTQTDLPLLVVVDVLTDMVENINDPKDISVFDKFRKMSNQLGLTFLFVIHENPGIESSKARGHIGTELLNKCSCVMQIGHNSDSKKDDDVELFRVSYLKTRNSKKPQSFVVKFDEVTESLILADEDEIKKTASVDKYNLPDFKNELQEFILQNSPKGLKPILLHFEKVWKVSHMVVSEKFHMLVDKLIHEEQLFYFKNKTYILAKMKDNVDKRVQNLRFIEAEELIQLEQRNLEYSRV